MTTLLFVRHGQASFGQQNYDQLSDLGIRQAQMLGQQYAQAQRKIDDVITGDMVRHRDSAASFLKAYQSTQPPNLAHQPSADSINKIKIEDAKLIAELNEFNHEDIFMSSNPKFVTHEDVMAEISKAPKPKLRLAELFQDAFVRWHSGKYDDDYIESWSQFNSRVQQALQEVVAIAQSQSVQKHKSNSEETSTKDNKPHNTFIIFTSGGVIAAIAAGILNQGSLTAQQINQSLLNTGVTTVTIKDDELRLLSLNEHSHLYEKGEDYLTWY